MGEAARRGIDLWRKQHRKRSPERAVRDGKVAVVPARDVADLGKAAAEGVKVVEDRAAAEGRAQWARPRSTSTD